MDTTRTLNENIRTAVGIQIGDTTRSVKHNGKTCAHEVTKGKHLKEVFQETCDNEGHVVDSRTRGHELNNTNATYDTQ